jgi:hypothetical protein
VSIGNNIAVAMVEMQGMPGGRLTCTLTIFLTFLGKERWKRNREKGCRGAKHLAGYRVIGGNAGIFEVTG